MTFFLTLSFWSRVVRLSAQLAQHGMSAIPKHEPSLHNFEKLDLDGLSTKILGLVDRRDLLGLDEAFVLYHS